MRTLVSRVALHNAAQAIAPVAGGNATRGIGLFFVLPGNSPESQA